MLSASFVMLSAAERSRSMPAAPSTAHKYTHMSHYKRSILNQVHSKKRRLKLQHSSHSDRTGSTAKSDTGIQKCCTYPMFTTNVGNIPKKLMQLKSELHHAKMHQKQATSKNRNQYNP
jgi:hypothetical protein